MFLYASPRRHWLRFHMRPDPFMPSFTVLVVDCPVDLQAHVLIDNRGTRFLAARSTSVGNWKEGMLFGVVLGLLFCASCPLLSLPLCFSHLVRFLFPFIFARILLRYFSVIFSWSFLSYSSSRCTAASSNSWGSEEFKDMSNADISGDISSNDENIDEVDISITPSPLTQSEEPHRQPLG